MGSVRVFRDLVAAILRLDFRHREPAVVRIRLHPVQVPPRRIDRAARMRRVVRHHAQDVRGAVFHRLQHRSAGQQHVVALLDLPVVFQARGDIAVQLDARKGGGRIDGSVAFDRRRSSGSRFPRVRQVAGYAKRMHLRAVTRAEPSDDFAFGAAHDRDGLAVLHVVEVPSPFQLGLQHAHIRAVGVRHRVLRCAKALDRRDDGRDIRIHRTARHRRDRHRDALGQAVVRVVRAAQIDAVSRLAFPATCQLHFAISTAGCCADRETRRRLDCVDELRGDRGRRIVDGDADTDATATDV